MMIKAQARKLGSPAHAVNYLLRDTDAQGVVRQRVQTIYGTPQAFVNVASRLAFNKSYDSLVFGFAPSDKPTAQQIQGFVRAFEHTAFPGMRNRVCWLVVLHESELSVHLHIVVARVDLFTGKQFSVLAYGDRPLRKPHRHQRNGCSARWRAYGTPWRTDHRSPRKARRADGRCCRRSCHQRAP